MTTQSCPQLPGTVSRTPVTPCSGLSQLLVRRKPNSPSSFHVAAARSGTSWAMWSIR